MKKILGTASAALLMTGAALAGLTTTSASAAPGNPGVPSDPILVFEENFENGLADGESVQIPDYVGADGTTYTGTPYWTTGSFCNGIVLDSTSAGLFGCAAGAQLRSLANVLGLVDGQDATGAAANHAVAAYTNSPDADAGFPLAPGDVELATEASVAIPAGSRFLTFSVDSAAINCGVSAPLLSFYLFDGTDEIPSSNAPINPCTDPRAADFGGGISGGSFAADSSVLFSGTELGIVLRNENGSPAGNDAAFDNIRVLDATPQLDKNFGTTDGRFYTGDINFLTFTVTNTSELAEKSGWAFTDTLPEGMTVAGDASTTCDAATIAAPEGADTIEITEGTLGTGDASCTITVPVVTDAAGTFVNGPDDVTTTGLNEPGTSTVVFEDEDPELTIEKVALLDDVNENGLADAGEEIIYGFAVENTGNVDLTDVTIEDTFLDDAGVAVTPDSVDLAAGEDAEFLSDPYVVTAEDVAAGEIVNVAVAAGTGRNGERIESSDSSVATPTREPAVPAPPAPPADGSGVVGLLPDTGAGMGLLAAGLAGVGTLATGLTLARKRRTGAHAAL